MTWPLSNEAWSTLSPYLVPPMAAAVASIPPFRDLMAKSCMQRGEVVPKISVLHGLKEGIKGAPTVGLMVGSQMILQNNLEKGFSSWGVDKESLMPALSSSALVGLITAPIVAAFNSQTMGKGVIHAVKNISIRQCGAVALQEAAFVAGIKLADPLAIKAKASLGDSKVVECAVAFFSGATASLIGHPGNTALTRWQSGLPIEGFHQLKWGALRKAWAIGVFSIIYKETKSQLFSLGGTI